jgi:hypothetical protein
MEMLEKKHKKADLLKKLTDKVRAGNDKGKRPQIRSHEIFLALQAFGAYRPNAVQLFGHAVCAVAREVQEHPWMVIRKPK